MSSFTARLLLLFLAATVILPAENWPVFRGPSRQGISSETNLPLKWDENTNIDWKQKIPGAGWSSPVVWGDRVFVTTADDGGASCRVLSLDASTGCILWDKEVFRQKILPKREQNSYATPTPATDGERVYAVFSDGGFAALDFDGNIVWTNRDYEYFSQHGLGASPILYEDLLIMPFDGSSPEAEKVGWKIPWGGASIWALDVETGKLRWEAKRGLSRIAHVTPNILKRDGMVQLVSGAGDVIQGFDIRNGKLLWTRYSQGEGVVPSIVLGGGLIYTASGFEASTIRVVKPGGGIAWEVARSVPHIPSFLYHDGLLYTMDENGIALCLRAGTGEVVWQQRVGGTHAASPVYAGGRIYFLSEEAETVVIKPGEEYKELARNPLPGRAKASIAVSRGALFLRTDQELYCIRQQERAAN